MTSEEQICNLKQLVIRREAEIKALKEQENAELVAAKRLIRRAKGAMVYAYDDHIDQFYLNVKTELQAYIDKYGSNDNVKR